MNITKDNLLLVSNAGFVNTNLPWFYRGGNYNNTTNAGVFNFNNTNGNANTTYSFRLVL